MSLVDRNRRPAIVLCAILFAGVIVRTAWVCDDAYITFRTVDNFVNGYGLTWNPGERVQTFTHPLWMFQIAGFYAITNEPFYTSLFVSIGLSTAAVLVYGLRIARSLEAGLLGILILTLSKAFTDYATSGLENPLTHLALALFFVAWFTRSAGPRRFFLLSLLAALAMLNRMDAGLLVVPAVAVEFIRQPTRRLLAAGILGLLPFLAWEAFSLLYYGFPFPNTAYAKLNVGIPRTVLAMQGLHYLWTSLQMDPLTIVAIAGGVALPFATRQRHLLPFSFAIGLHLAYVVYIGGCFMSGRYLTAPLFCSVVLISQAENIRRRSWIKVICLVVVLAGLSPCPTVLSGADYGAQWPFTETEGIADERGMAYQGAGLLNAGGARVEDHGWAAAARKARDDDVTLTVQSSIGIYGYYAGPDIHVIDANALADPLLARLPPRDIVWRIGHFKRAVPKGYPPSLIGGQNLIEDTRVAALFDHLVLITRAELLDPVRLLTIWEINTGGCTNLVEPLYQAYALQLEAARFADGKEWPECIDAAKRAVERDPARGSAWYLLALGHRLEGNLKEAEIAILAALWVRPGVLGYRNECRRIAETHRSHGRTEEAIALYGRLLDLCPDDALGYHGLGILRCEVGAYDQAASSFRSAIGLSPEFYQAHLALGLALERQGKGDDALAVYRNTLSLELDPDDVRLVRGRIDGLLDGAGVE